MNRRVFLSLFSLGGAALIAGCGGGGSDSGGGNSDVFDQQILTAYQRLADSIEGEDTFNLTLNISQNYLDSGTTQVGLVTAFGTIFDTYNNIQMDVQVNDITYDSSSSPYYAYVKLAYQLTGIPNNGSARVDIDDQDLTRDVEMTWHYEDSRWKMYGNQSAQAAASALTKTLGKKALHLGTPSGK